MTITHLLEDFSALPMADDHLNHLTDVALEDQRLASFEQGYTAGWDDAFKAQAEDHARITAALGRNLEDLAFSYHEALAQLLQLTSPVLQAIADRIVPEIMRQSLGPVIAEQLQDMIREQAEQPVRLIVPRGSAAPLQDVVAKTISVPLALEEDPALGDGQVTIQVGDLEREIDTGICIDGIRSAIEAFSYHVHEEQSHERTA